jgi:hypothetical protein
MPRNPRDARWPRLQSRLADISDELRSRPYERVEVAGGYHHRTRPLYGEVIRASGTVATPAVDLSPVEKLVLTVIAYFQPVTRMGRCRHSRQAHQPRCDRGVAQLRSDRHGAAQPAGPAPPQHLCHDAGVPGTRRIGDACATSPTSTSSKKQVCSARRPLPDELRDALGLRDEPEDEQGAGSEAEEHEFRVALFED